MVLITKGRGKYRGIGLVDVIWKVCALIINNRLRDAITFHNVLHGFRHGRGEGTETMEEKWSSSLLGCVLNLFIMFPYMYGKHIAP